MKVDKLSPFLPEDALTGSVISSVLVFSFRPCNISMKEPSVFSKYSFSSQWVSDTHCHNVVYLADSLIFKLA